MNWFTRVLRRAVPGAGRSPGTQDAVKQELAKTESTVATALVFGAQVRDSQLGVMDHSARVSLVADRIARQMGIGEADRYLLTLAARLHELGMFAVPQELLRRPAPLSTEELRQVRAQAGISAEVARLVHPPRVVHLIEHQYEDHRQVARTRRLEERDLLLAGILRVADVFAAVTWPRPYQDPMPVEFRDELLRSGAGTLFHPLAVRSALGLQAPLQGESLA
jgi:HD-GYP domain-containing protein (c-di-GMP phosphodiesterase class II)